MGQTIIGTFAAENKPRIIHVVQADEILSGPRGLCCRLQDSAGGLGCQPKSALAEECYRMAANTHDEDQRTGLYPAEVPLAVGGISQPWYTGRRQETLGSGRVADKGYCEGQF